MNTATVQTSNRLLCQTTSPCRTSVIQPMQLGMDGKMREITPEDMRKLTNNPLLQPDEPTNSGSEDEA